MSTPPNACQMTPNMMITPEGGLAIRVYNDTGAPLLKGYVVKASTLVDDAVVLTAPSDVDPVGVVYADFATGTWGWIVIDGYADVYLDNAGVTPREAWIGTSNTTPGQCTSGPLPSPPNANGHFQEVGHSVRTRTGAGLVRSILHFL